MTHYELVKWLHDNGWVLIKKFNTLETWSKGDKTKQFKENTKYPKAIKEIFYV